MSLVSKTISRGFEVHDVYDVTTGVERPWVSASWPRSSRLPTHVSRNQRVVHAFPGGRNGHGIDAASALFMRLSLDVIDGCAAQKSQFDDGVGNLRYRNRDVRRVVLPAASMNKTRPLGRRR